MNLQNEIREAMLSGVNAINKAAATVAETKKNANAYVYKATYSEALEKAENELKTAKDEARKGVHAIVEKYKAELNERFMPKGEEITEDAKLLTAGLKLTAEELENLFNKYNGATSNETMKRLIAEYADNNGITLNCAYYSKRDYADAAETLEKYAYSAFTRPEYSDIWNNAEDMAKIVPDCLK